jgi:hypothetical protein
MADLKKGLKCDSQFPDIRRLYFPSRVRFVLAMAVLTASDY